jgi:hypothetical protein
VSALTQLWWLQADHTARPNRLMVDESPSDDNSVAIMHPNTMEALGLFRWVCSYHGLQRFSC